jgi:gamma-glutamyl:cysteine ligase YbdK (ATP-grasp superfamily)
MSTDPLHLFEATGIELEYMIVDRGSLAVKPVADRVLAAQAGKIVSDVELGPIAWSNELVLHVIELKSNGPAPRLAGLAETFTEHIGRINTLLAPLDGRLMPGACHPWMDPLTETVLWPHEYSPVYEAYNRIFDCRGHGWSNLQSLHINLPFCGDEEFGRLHAAIRLLLPIMPALTASSPILDGRRTGFLDSRMEVYRHNSERIPSVAGRIIPEPVYDHAAYDREIFQRMYADIAPHDPEGTLQEEFLNARGAIARFDRGAIEIRVLDVQECPAADLAGAALITATLKALCAGQWCDLERIKAFDTGLLADIFLSVIKDGDTALVSHGSYLEALGLNAAPRRAGQVWQHLAAATAKLNPDWQDPLLARAGRTLLEKGCLARRIDTVVNGDLRREKLFEVYGRLCDCLARAEMFV